MYHGHAVALKYFTMKFSFSIIPLYNGHFIQGQAPLQTLMKLKVFYKGYFRQNKGCFIEILTKIKSKLTSNFLVFLSDLLNPCYDR